MKMLVTFASGWRHEEAKAAKSRETHSQFSTLHFQLIWAQPFKQKGIGEWKCSWLSLQGDNAEEQSSQSQDKRNLNSPLSIFN